MMMLNSQKEQQRKENAPPPAELVETTAPPVIAESVEVVEAATEPVIVVPGEAAEATESVAEKLFYLENDLITVEFTTHGGGIKTVAMKAYPAEKGSDRPYVFNQYGDSPVLGVSLNKGSFNLSFEMVSMAGNEIVFERTQADGLVIKKTFWITESSSGEEEYNIRHSLELYNPTSQNLLINDYSLSVGTIEPALLGGGSILGGYLNLGYYENEDTEFILSTKFIATDGFMGMGANKDPAHYITEQTAFEWVSIKNQFFVSILTPDLPGSSITVTPKHLDFKNDKGEPVNAIQGQGSFSLAGLPSNERVSRGMNLYVGPKEYFRLQDGELMHNNQEEVMQFGWFSPVSKILLLGMKSIHNVIPNWGLAIIIITIVLKFVFWPLTRIAARSAKKMQKMQVPMKAMQEKFKDNPTKKNQEMMRLYKEHKVNPLGGCLPMLVQIPIFIGFFYMLRTSSELRFAEFLWISDLSQPEKLFSWGVNVPFLGNYFNLLPILMGVSMFFQMRMTPTSASPEQQSIMKFMPVMMVVMLYNFGSGLCLYWTTQNLMTILQQTITNRSKDKDEAPAGTVTLETDSQRDNPLIRKKPKKKNKPQQ